MSKSKSSKRKKTSRTKNKLTSASDSGGVILETTPGGRVMDGWGAMNDLPWDAKTGKPGPYAKDFWKAISQKYAEGAAGNVSVVQTANKAAKGGGELWKEIELPAVQKGQKAGRVGTITTTVLPPHDEPMTKAYDLFKKELVAQGRERLDGFGLSWVRGLTDEERVLVRQELTTLLNENDTRAPEALEALDGQDSIPQIAAALAASKWEDFRAAASESLLRLTSDVAYVHVLEDLLLRAKDEGVRNRAAGCLESAPTNVSTVDPTLLNALSSEFVSSNDIVKAEEIVRRYVSEKYAWNESVYEICVDSKESARNTVNFLVRHRDDTRRDRPPSPGGGKSFLVEVDMQKMTVLREIRFQ